MVALKILKTLGTDILGIQNLGRSLAIDFVVSIHSEVVSV
jgi:hypothetical protein